jgi:hypothetical protein
MVWRKCASARTNTIVPIAANAVAAKAYRLALAFCDLRHAEITARRAQFGVRTAPPPPVPRFWKPLFAGFIAGANAGFGAEVVRYAFLVEDLDPCSLPVSRRTQIWS